MLLEVEQKFPVAGFAEVEARLQLLHAVERGTVVQQDTYYNHPARDFGQTDEALRIRQVGERNFVTYKGPKLDAETKTREEIELPLCSGSDCAEQFGRLFVALGFSRVAAVCKRRRTYEVSWEGRQAEVALDDVEGLGTFVEVELAAAPADLDDARRVLASLTERLGLAASERRSYLELLLGQ